MKEQPSFVGSVIESFCKATCIYPPSHLFGGVSNPTAKDKKAEQRVSVACESLYAIDCGTLRDLRTAMQEVIVCESFCKNIKPEYFINKTAVLQAHLKYAVSKMTDVYKKDPLLKEYFTDMMVDLTKDVQNNFIFRIVDEKITCMETKDIAKLYCITLEEELRRIYK